MVAYIVEAVTPFPEKAPSARINDVVVPAALIPSNKLLTLSGLPVPFLMDNPSNTALITISGVVELSYACCNVVVEIPPVPPNASPNFDTKLNTA